MELIIQEKKIVLSNEIQSIQIIEKKLNEALKDTDYLFSHFIIDGVEVFSEYEQYFRENLLNLKKIEAVFKKEATIIHESLNSIEMYFDQALPEIKIFAEELYSNEQNIASPKTIYLLEGIEWIYTTITTINQLKERPRYWKDMQVKIVELENILKEVEAVFENQDTILFADMLSFEIEPLFVEFQKTVQNIIDLEGVRNGLH